MTRRWSIALSSSPKRSVFPLPLLCSTTVPFVPPNFYACPRGTRSIAPVIRSASSSSWLHRCLHGFQNPACRRLGPEPAVERRASRQGRSRSGDGSLKIKCLEIMGASRRATAREMSAPGIFRRFSKCIGVKQFGGRLRDRNCPIAVRPRRSKPRSYQGRSSATSRRKADLSFSVSVSRSS